MKFFNLTLSRRSVGQLAAVTAAAVLTACGSSSDPTALLRVVHAVADAPRVNVYLNERLALEEVDFRAGTGYMVVEAGTYDVRVEAIVPGGNIDVIDASGVFLAEDTRTTVYAVGDTSADTIAPWVIADPTVAVSAGNIRATVVHASPDAPEVSVFVTAPGADIASSAPLGSFSFGETLGPVQVPAGDYQVRVALGNAAGPFTASDVVYDAGTVSLPAGADLQLAAVTNTTNGPAPISVIVLDGEGSVDLFDQETGALLRAVHGSPDAPPVDVVVNDNFAMPAVMNLAYTEFTGFLGPLPAGPYNLKVAPTGTTNAVLDVDAELEAGRAYTALAYDLLGAPIKALLLVDDNRRVATEAKLRIVHASPTAGDVDIYLLPPTTLPSDAGVEPSFAAVPFGAETGFFGVPAGTYDVYVTPAGDPATLAISAPGVPVTTSGIYTVIARDATGGGAPLGLILADDFAP